MAAPVSCRSTDAGLMARPTSATLTLRHLDASGLAVDRDLRAGAAEHPERRDVGRLASLCVRLYMWARAEANDRPGLHPEPGEHGLSECHAYGFRTPGLDLIA